MTVLYFTGPTSGTQTYSMVGGAAVGASAQGTLTLGVGAEELEGNASVGTSALGVLADLGVPMVGNAAVGTSMQATFSLRFGVLLGRSSTDTSAQCALSSNLGPVFAPAAQFTVACAQEQQMSSPLENRTSSIGVFERQSVPFRARVVNGRNVYPLLSEIQSVTLYIYDATDGGALVHQDDFDAEDVYTEALRSGPEWQRPGPGYNLEVTVPGDELNKGGHGYDVEIVLEVDAETDTGCEKIAFKGRIEVRGLRSA